VINQKQLRSRPGADGLPRRRVRRSGAARQQKGEGRNGRFGDCKGLESRARVRSTALGWVPVVEHDAGPGGPRDSSGLPGDRLVKW